MPASTVGRHGQRRDTAGGRPPLRGSGGHRRAPPPPHAPPPPPRPAQRRLPGQGPRPAPAPGRLPPLRAAPSRPHHQAPQRALHLLRRRPRPGEGAAPHDGPPRRRVGRGGGGPLGRRRPVLTGDLTSPGSLTLEYGVRCYPDRVRTIVEALDRAVRLFPDVVAIETPEGDVTYAELADLVEGAAEKLAEEGLVPGDRFAVALRNGLDIVVAIW